MESNKDAIDYISTLLDSGKYKEALGILSDAKYIDSFPDYCWDLIPVVLAKIQDDTIIVRPSLYGACEELLIAIIQKTTPEEALLEFIEQIELAKNDSQFGLILGTLQGLLKKLIVKKGRSLEWCLNSISTYIETIPIPEHHLEGQERLLLDSDLNIRRIIRVYTLLLPFYKPFVIELCSGDNNAIVSHVRTKQVIVAFLTSLLGKPLIHIDVDPVSNEKSEAHSCWSEIIQDICVLEKNIWKLIQLLETCHKENIKTKTKPFKDSGEELTPYEHREKINLTTLSGLTYAVFSGHFNVPDMAVPQVFSVEYIVHTLLLSAVHLLSFSEYGPLAKAIVLCNVIKNYMPVNSSHMMLTCSVHFELCKALTNVAIFSVYEQIRKNSVTFLGCYINKFDYKGRCMLIKYLIESSNHSGMIGYAITLYKDSVNQAFKDPVLNDCFCGAQLASMIKKICHLPHGAESDLVELADQIITSLNFLRYLTLKDDTNKTGIKECFDFIEADYLDKLRTGLNMSKAHYELKLKDLEEGKTLPDEKLNVSINVGGNVLDKIPKKNQKEIILSALNAFHLIEGLVARLSECINMNKVLIV